MKQHASQYVVLGYSFGTFLYAISMAATYIPQHVSKYSHSIHFQNPHPLWNNSTTKKFQDQWGNTFLPRLIISQNKEKHMHITVKRIYPSLKCSTAQQLLQDYKDMEIKYHLLHNYLEKNRKTLASDTQKILNRILALIGPLIIPPTYTYHTSTYHNTIEHRLRLEPFLHEGTIDNPLVPEWQGINTTESINAPILENATGEVTIARQLVRYLTDCGKPHFIYKDDKKPTAILRKSCIIYKSARKTDSFYRDILSEYENLPQKLLDSEKDYLVEKNYWHYINTVYQNTLVPLFMNPPVQAEPDSTAQMEELFCLFRSINRHTRSTKFTRPTKLRTRLKQLLYTIEPVVEPLTPVYRTSHPQAPLPHKEL